MTNRAIFVIKNHVKEPLGHCSCVQGGHVVDNAKL